MIIPPKWVLAIDPGRTMGWALFRDGVLVDCGHCSMKAFHACKISPQAKRFGAKLPPLPENLPDGVILVGEKPVHYPHGRQDNKSPPNDLIALGITLGEILGVYRRKVEMVELVTANEWKGSIPKPVCHSRIKKILTPDEEMPENHNARDAVGIGLQRVGRYKR